MDKKVSFSESRQPEILRAYQRDEEYKMILRYLFFESLEVFVNYRTLSKYDAEIKMTSDFLYYLLTTIRGKQTLGEEYCSIIPVKANPQQKLKEAFPSMSRRILLSLINVLGPYAVHRILRKFEQPFTDQIIQLNSKLTEKTEQVDTKVTFGEILKVQLLNLIPDILFGTLTKDFSQMHLALFFVWGKYYELAKRFTKIIYKYESGLEGQHGISYLRPGRIIMFTIVIQLSIFLFKVIKTIKSSYQMYRRIESQKAKKIEERNKRLSNPQEDSGINEENQDEEPAQEVNSERNQCILCYGTRVSTTVTQCGHLFCWDCIHTSLRVKAECPQCREPCAPQKLVMIYNY